ncbi:hypothetical protein KQI84_17035 [bacterium]|nr:hypothetical protein [bacterium]
MSARPTFLTYDAPDRQYVDLLSRLGVSMDPKLATFGIARGHLASQREGKVFMAPMLRAEVIDPQNGAILAGGLEGDLQSRRVACHPWGFEEFAEENGVGIAFRVSYAAMDVVAVNVEVTNRRDASMDLAMRFESACADGAEDAIATCNGETQTVAIAQTSRPTSQWQLRPEPDFRIVTLLRPQFDFECDGLIGETSCAAITPTFELEAGESREFPLLLTAASHDMRTETEKNSEALARILSIATRRLDEAAKRTPQEIVEAARARWEAQFAAYDLSRIEPEYHGLVRQAMTILLKNSIAPQLECDFGSQMHGFLGTFPARHGYEAFWIWDSAKHAWGFAEWNTALARDNVLVMLSNQDPETGQLYMVHPDSRIASTQPPLFANAAMLIFERESPTHPLAAREFLADVYEPLAKWNAWWFAECDTNGNGLMEWPNNLCSGWDDSARWDTDRKAGWGNDDGAAKLDAVDLNSFLVADMRELARIATELGRNEEAREWQGKADRLAELIVENLYDERDALFYDRHIETDEFVRIPTPASFMPLWAGVPLDAERTRDVLQRHLLNEAEFFGPYPFPTIAYSHAKYDAAGASGYWRGPVWLDQAFFMLATLERHRDVLDPDYRERIDEARRRILSMAMMNGIHENYNSKTGKRGANSKEHFSWSAASLIAIAAGEM